MDTCKRNPPRLMRSALLAAVTAFILLPAPPAQALSISVTECSIQAFFCPLANTIAAGTQTDGVGLLGIGGAAGFAYNFNNADVNFAGNVIATDTLGVIDFIDGIGTATTNQANAAPFWLNVDINESYVTNPGIVGLIGVGTEFNVGNCNAAAAAAGSFVQTQMVIDGTILPAMGALGDSCAAPVVGGLAPFAYNGAALVGITQPVVMDGVAQFQFNAAAGGQAIDLPFGEQDEAPEPATFALIGSGLIALGFFRWKKV